MKQMAIILTAPSGGGKRTLTEHVLEKFPEIRTTVSLTTRARRENEQDGVHYDFVTVEEFQRRKNADKLIEWNEHFGNFYAAQKKEAERIWSEGKVPLFELEVHGALNAKQYFGDKAALVFIDVPSLDVLEQRLRHRGTETDEQIQERLSRAEYERSFRDQFEYIVMNDELDQAKRDIEDTIKKILTK